MVAELDCFDSFTVLNGASPPAFLRERFAMDELEFRVLQLVDVAFTDPASGASLVSWAVRFRLTRDVIGTVKMALHAEAVSMMVGEVKMLDEEWRGCADHACMEVRLIDGTVQVRDSKDPDGPVLSFTRAEWEAVLDGVERGHFDLPPV